MQPAHFRHQLRSGAQEQVVGVAEDDLRPDRAQVVGGDGLHRRGGAHGHELGRVNLAVGECQLAAPGRAVAMGDGEVHAISIASP